MARTAGLNVLPLQELDDDLFGSALDLRQREELETDPDTPPTTGDELRRLATDDRRDGNRHERFAVVDGDRVRVVAHLELENDKENAHLASSEIYGADEDPDAARVALGHMLEVAISAGRTSMIGWGPNTEKYHAFWTSTGAERKYLERISGLDMLGVDADLMAAWVEQRDERAADVELVRWVGPTPAEYMDAWAISRTAE